MFALTFFGILHVPINIPALAFNIGEDHLDLDRELMAHGVTNALSGLAGSIQNYLVYTNSVLFIKSGGNSRVAGFLLAVATFFIMISGPGIIGFIPVMMVGVLIFVLGFELVCEAIWDPRKKLKPLEYLTVIAIVLVMGIYDFVVGIFVGIGLAFVSLVVQTSRVPAVRASYSGEIAGSTVRRNPVQHDYLRRVGKQIHVTKLAGYLFFGTIVSVEARIRSLIEEEAFNNRPIRYLIFDLWHVTDIDYSAAEVFNRLNRIFSRKGVTIVMSGVDSESAIGLSLRAVGLGENGNEVKLLPDLNSALESCENELLKTLYYSKEVRNARNARTNTVSRDLDVPRSNNSVRYSIDTQFSSPRRAYLHAAATSTLETTERAQKSHKWQNFAEPLRLLLQTFQGLTDKNEDFWFRAVAYFTRREYLAGTVLYTAHQPADEFYLLEDGILRADYDLPQGRYFESIVAGTTCGELPFFGETERSATVVAERDCVAWAMGREQWRLLQEREADVAQELLRVSLKLTSERMAAITSYVLTTAG
jgi:SulP family sulfate permease